MKKGIIILLTIAALAIAGIFIFIPSKIKISSVSKTHANSDGALRLLLNDDNWAKWWPSDKVFQLDGSSYSISKKMISGFELMISKDADSVASRLLVIGITVDTTVLTWSCELETGNNPFKRLAGYKKAVAIKKNINLLLDSLQSFLSDQKNIYGIVAKQVKVTDSVLISTRKSFDHYPDEFETDILIQKLRAYIKAGNAKETNYPMLNVRQVDENKFEAMVAIATDKSLPDDNDFATKMVVKNGNLMVAEITGGHARIRQAFIEFDKLIEDYNKTPPAIPYQLIITDRTKEPDTNKWVTKLCYPILM
jgi:hypothetical protein